MRYVKRQLMCNNADLRVPKEIYQEICTTKETYLFQKGPNKRICITTVTCVDQENYAVTKDAYFYD